MRSYHGNRWRRYVVRGKRKGENDVTKKSKEGDQQR